MSGTRPAGMGGPMGRGYRIDRSAVDAKVSRKTLRRVAGIAVPHRGLIGVFLFFTVLDAAITVVNPLLVVHIINDGIRERDGSTIAWLAGAMVLTALVDASFTVINGWLSSRIGEGLIYDLRTQVFAHVQRMSLAFFTRTQTGALVSRLNNDVMGAQRAFTSVLSSVVSNSISVVVVGIAMLALSWQVTLVCLATFPLLFLASRWVGNRLAGLTREQMDGNAALGNVMTERFNVGGALLLTLFGRHADEDRTYAERADRVRDLGVRITLVGRVFTAALLLVPALATALVYGIGGGLVVSGALSLGALVGLATLLLRLLGPLQGLSNVRVDVMTALVSFDRVFEVTDLPSMVQDRPGATDLPAGAAAVEFDDVWFRYPLAEEVSLASLETLARPEGSANPDVLRGLSFRAEPGQMVALVGPSGAGKTTLTHLVARLYDVTGGAVRIGTGGEDMSDVRDVTLDSLHRTVGYVTQDAHMFHDTIAANLRYARPDATDDDLWSALEAAQIAPMVAGLSDGLDTVVGDRGYRLSGGERQRLAIARLLLKAPPVVVLDEATAHLDSESEHAVQEALSRALEGRTSLVIAHRLSTIRDADQILVVDGGRVAQSGTHEELLAAGGLYADLYRTQFLDDVSPGVSP
ncbi:ABC transporter [Marmoricola endophyticus]|uniref:ABC transporter n=1 Tax=Marmoricola endophyticus TaxID=2040280 RepID=A0A917BB75_9ACTN|nr:ABC transporter ATP-binding protein [Marmoricola endophyticus]GGF33907.1 ABC transporter [Marmoricola endophyticus]